MKNKIPEFGKTHVPASKQKEEGQNALTTGALKRAVANRDDESQNDELREINR